MGTKHSWGTKCYQVELECQTQAFSSGLEMHRTMAPRYHAVQYEGFVPPETRGNVSKFEAHIVSKLIA